MNLRFRKNCWQQDITRWEWVWICAKPAGIVILTAWLFYRKLWAALVLIPMWYWYFQMGVRELEDKKRSEFQLQFKEMLQTLSASLNTGYSVENAFKETQKELKLLYPDNARASKELLFITRQLRLQVPLEKILEEFAGRVEVEDVDSFATVFSAAKKSGGDMLEIIRNTAGQIGDKIDVKREVDTILAAKRYEFRVMAVIPYAIITYMGFSFPEFMDQLYGNVLGIGVMTVCLAIYISAYYLGTRIIRIEM